MSLETDKEALIKIKELVKEIGDIITAQPDIEFVGWKEVADDAFYLDASINLELAKLDEHSKD